MKFLHTADLHLGQVMYQNYTREDEHDHYFSQLKKWCGEYHPDALLVSGDIFDIQQPGAATKRHFNEFFVELHHAYPTMCIVITAGNHDSASRIHADNAVWSLGNIKIVGAAPSNECLTQEEGWQQEYIVELPMGYIIAMPYSTQPKREVVQSILDYVTARNADGKPVILMGHLAVTGMDATGHGDEIGRIQTLSPDELGNGFDYMALGHIHRPQTIGQPDEEHLPTSTYPAGVIRYSGSALHVNCDEKYPHTVSLVDIEHHGGEVRLTRLRINEKRHFYELPQGTCAHSAEEAMTAIRDFAENKKSGYFRLCMDYHAATPSDFDQQIYSLIESYGDEIRYNPRIIYTNVPTEKQVAEKPKFDVADLQQMTDPMVFIEQTISQYPMLNLDELREAFKEIEQEMAKTQE